MPFNTTTLRHDLAAGLVVFLVALPLCLGIALASGAPLFAGVLSGIIGGIVVGLISGSQTSVSGPAAGLTAVVLAQIATLETYNAFLLAVFFAGAIQIGLGIVRAGFISAFVPTSVLKGLLAAIGVILILKQIPHLFGHDVDPEGDFAFFQPDKENTLSELWRFLSFIHPGAAVIGVSTLALSFAWDNIKPLKKSPIPSPLIVVILGTVMGLIFERIGGAWLIEESHLVQVPVARDWESFTKFFTFPDWSRWMDGRVLTAAVTIAIVASLETLLNIEAIDKIDPQQRNSPPDRELFAQGCGNLLAGLIGGLPITSVVIRSSANLNAGAKTKLSTVFHGLLLVLGVLAVPQWLNRIPLACLAAILLHTGTKLVSPKLFKKMWNSGWSQFLPFVVTIVAIVFSDLLVGILIGLAVSIAFILHGNMKRPLRQIREKYVSGEVLRIELANQVSFLNRAVLTNTLDGVGAGSHVLLDARNTNYIDPDVLDLIRDYETSTAPARGVKVSLVGFQEKYQIRNHIEYIDHSSRELQERMQPEHVLQVFKDGNERFRNGRHLMRDLNRQVDATADGQFPLAVVLSCIDSRAATELIFDLGVGDSFTIRVAGNVASNKVLGSMEYACAVAGAKLALVLGHTRCGAVTSAVDLLQAGKTAMEATKCEHLDTIINEIQRGIEPAALDETMLRNKSGREALIDRIAQENVRITMQTIRRKSRTLAKLADDGKIAIVGGLYDVRTARVEFFV